MKKLSIIVILALVCVLCFAGCGEEPTSTLDLSECEIGYEFEVYPNVEFDYKINDDFIVHISDIKVTLVEKNEINANDILEDRFYPNIMKTEIIGHTDSKHAGTTIYIFMESETNNFYSKTTISNDGTFHSQGKIASIKTNCIIYFTHITI